MSFQKGLRLMALATLVLGIASVSAFAKNSRTIKIAYDATLNGTKVPPGDYEVAWQTHSPEATVTISDAKRLVVSTTGKWEARDIKYDHNSVVYDTNSDGTRIILEIRFAGMKGALVFGPTS